MESSSSLELTKSLGSLIKLARINNYTQDELAHRLGISRSTMGSIEKGKTSVSIGLYFEALTILGIEQALTEFIDGLASNFIQGRSRASIAKVELPDDF